MSSKLKIPEIAKEEYSSGIYKGVGFEIHGSPYKNTACLFARRAKAREFLPKCYADGEDEFYAWIDENILDEFDAIWTSVELDRCHRIVLPKYSKIETEIHAHGNYHAYTMDTRKSISIVKAIIDRFPRIAIEKTLRGLK